MDQLASKIKSQMDTLASEYDLRLREIDDYANLPAQERLQVSRTDLLTVAAGLETGDQVRFAQYVQTTAEQRVNRGFRVESVEQALTALISILEPMLTTVQMSSTFWRAMLQVHEALTDRTMDRMLAAEKLLRQGEEEQRQILDAVPAMVWYKDSENRILRLNRAAAATMGLSVAEAEGKSVYDLNPDEAEAYHTDDLEVIESGKPKIGIVEPLMSSSGETRWLQTDKIPYTDDDGNIIGVIVFGLDVTERIKLMDQVQESLERRGRQVQISTEVAQEIATAPAIDELYRRVVTLVKEQFGYYHAQFFLLNPQGDRLETVSGYGTLGDQFLELGHFIPVGKGVVGRAGASGHAVMSPDVSQDPQWISHPLLPKTKGELAVPIKMRDRVLGVLDVQSDQANALSEDDQLLLEGLCGQIALAMESTRLRQETEESLRELTRLYRSVSREGWDAYQRESGMHSYLFDRTSVVAADLTDIPSDDAAVVAPLSVRGEAFGTLGVHTDPEVPLSSEELALVDSVAEQVAQALESARLFEQTQVALSETEELYQSSADLTAAQTYDQVVQALRAHSFLGEADHSVNLALFDRPWNRDEMPNWIATVAQWSQSPSEGALRYRPQDFPSLAVLLQPDSATIISEVGTDPRLDENLRTMYIERHSVHSIVAAPLMVGGQWFGYVEGLYKKQIDFSEGQVRRLMALAAQAAVTVQNLRQLEITQARAERERLVRSITNRIRQGTDRETIMRTAVQELGRMLGSSHSVLRLGSRVRLLEEQNEPVPERPEEQWTQKAEEAQSVQGYFRIGDKEGLTVNAWLPGMTQAVEQAMTVSSSEPETGARLALLIHLYGEVIGVLGFGRDSGEQWTPEQIAAAETIVEQIGWALESQRLFDEEQQARSLLGMRVNALDCLNDIGRKIDEAPPVVDFLEWVAVRIPPAMQFPEVCRTSIAFNGDIYGATEAVDLPYQIVQNLIIGGESMGRVTIAYTEDRGFLDEESSLLGDIARRVGGYIENRRLVQETQEAAQVLDEERTLLRSLIDSIPDLVYTKDTESRFVLNNKAHLHSLGVTSQEEVVGKTDLDIFPSEFAGQYYADEQALLASGEPLQGREEPVQNQTTGQVGWILTTKVPLRDASGKVIGLVGVGRDISDRREAEMVLERRRAQLECLSDIGQRIGESPPVSEFLDWVAQRIPSAMQHPESSVAAIRFNGHVHGTSEAIELPFQIVQSLYVSDEQVGRVCIAYTEEHEFLDEESALLGDIARRVSGYIENQKLLQETRTRAEREHAVRTATDRVREGADAEAIMRTGLEELSRVLGTSKMILRLGSRDQLIDRPPAPALDGGDEHSPDTSGNGSNGERQ